MTQLILIRHGETDWNRTRRIQGHTDIGLNPDGIEQSRRVARRLAAEPIDIVLSSDLLRARETAGAIVQATGKPMRTLTALRERHFGLFEGLTASDIEQRHPVEYSRWRARDPAYTLPGGESLNTFFARVHTALGDIVRSYRNQTAVIVCHGGVLDVAYRLATGLPIEAPRPQTLYNASINRLRADADGASFALLAWGDVSHLEAGAADELDRRVV